MAWFPMKGVIRKLRTERKWTHDELARKAGVKPRTIRMWESEHPPRTAHDDTVRGFAAAFSVKPEEIAEWHDRDPKLDDADAASAALKSTLAMRAARDDVREWVTLPNGRRIEVLRPRLLHRIKSAPGLHDGNVAIGGKVSDHRGMPAIVSEVLDVAVSRCAQFLIVRRVDRGDLLYASVFTSSHAQTARLLDAADQKASVTVIARIAVREPTPKWRDFRGFVFFQKRGEKPQMHRWAFVVEDVLEGFNPTQEVCSVLPPTLPKRKASRRSSGDSP
jgi:transcriptional regulator with XRE-family HTH domain